ncbi:MAG: GlcG protein [Novosphingobium sp. 28-62-57]|uniref:GlcG/HbpS family heme-binding protein n=1 Tax=unclassified Novosphingobium TaxID=2644732 RepID=UPI000BDB86AF|nr:MULTISPECIES: heme-binding protein [unclassified Novosphingobium]OYW50392.1 MAG: GlcG protein [Novosphingobium sp. 12-62-10]OYZ35915.1 MAG: GlcG protein [Novosphingobium sp. 16-62-11]OZA36214.1 MAG: GlcG protein [Novosphingobium sp. 17-62-9]OYZ11503.1 MAG: GlcG protein [Novosphingobium sp. 28-62-57]HQS68578.1 heme-binding protein [Novosphingobium sp.]
MTLSLNAAQTIIAAALAEARARHAKPLAIIVLDAGGHPISFAREDGATMFRHDIARAKALGAIGMGDDTRVIAERAKGNPAFFQSVTAVVGGNIAFSPGGVLIRDGGAVIGAVGVSGDTGDCDEECAFAGIRAAGFNLETAK